MDANQNGDAKKKTYHRKATGQALQTVEKHSGEDELKLFGSCFCPFVQRVWISLELKQLSYQYIEVDPYAKPKELMEVNPRGLVPGLRHGDWGCYESTVLMEYLEDLQQGEALLPPDAKLRALSRLWTDHAQDEKDQIKFAEELKKEISKLVEAGSQSGPFFLGEKMSFVDVQMAPWVIRLRKVLQPYRGWPDPEKGSRWAEWVEAIENHPASQATTSSDDLYLDSYERYAENRPNTSQVQQAINSGRGLP
ncbi:hypothetical protein MBLNU459_g6910t2 [Dothideomycetes sp. NU459]